MQKAIHYGWLPVVPLDFIKYAVLLLIQSHGLAPIRRISRGYK